MLEENWDTVHVFMLCKQDWVTSMVGAYALGFTAQEVESGCRLRRVSSDSWPEVSEQVMDMGRIAANELNNRQK